jgi:hypothetical protein
MPSVTRETVAREAGHSKNCAERFGIPFVENYQGFSLLMTG